MYILFPLIVVCSLLLALCEQPKLVPSSHSLERSVLGGGVPEIVASDFAEWAETRGAIALALDHVAVDAELVAFPA